MKKIVLNRIPNIKVGILSSVILHHEIIRFIKNIFRALSSDLIPLPLSQWSRPRICLVLLFAIEYHCVCMIFWFPITSLGLTSHSLRSIIHSSTFSHRFFCRRISHYYLSLLLFISFVTSSSTLGLLDSCNLTERSNNLILQSLLWILLSLSVPSKIFHRILICIGSNHWGNLFIVLDLKWLHQLSIHITINCSRLGWKVLQIPQFLWIVFKLYWLRCLKFLLLISYSN